MKTAWALLLSLFLFAPDGFSQYTSSVFLLDKLPSNGVLLDKGWKFQHGDDTAYANPVFDDSHWQPINPTLDIDEQPPSARSGICWLRLHISIDSSLLKEQFSLLVSQAVASEIYLNGRLIHRFGTIGNYPKETIAVDPFGRILSCPFKKDSKQVLAVRYAVQPGILYTTSFARKNPLFLSKLNQMDASLEDFDYRWFQTGLPNSLIFRVGAFLILFILHLAFFLYYPSIKANLFFSLYAICEIAADLSMTGFGQQVRFIFFTSNLSYFFLQLENIFLLTALYLLVQKKRGWIYWGVVVAVFISYSLDVVNYRSAVAVFFANVVSFEMVRTAFRAMKLKMKGAWIIVTGAISFAIFDVAWYLVVVRNYMMTPISYHYTLGDLLYNLAFLSIPVSTSVYLALDFAFTSKALQQKLNEVEKLSSEKQQILASQNDMLEKQVGERTSELNHSLEELKITQRQLIHQEKMASLGELTAGIAHEIQNPLNFVNNFSDMNRELLGELKAEAEKGNIVEVKAIADNLITNEEKITRHGKRADSIVKGMLQHSRQTTGVKEPTDLNKLADEYLGLAYHGIRAKDIYFNAEITKDFDDKMGKINIVQQDIGRVLLNLYNNAFYAVNEKRKMQEGKYQPTVTVQTKRAEGGIKIRVSDNGNGIPPKMVEKIFQPFFTTKPTGEGTGLGLSLSYEVIKAHGGEIKVETKEGEGSTFVIWLPV